MLNIQENAMQKNILKTPNGAPTPHVCSFASNMPASKRQQKHTSLVYNHPFFCSARTWPAACSLFRPRAARGVSSMRNGTRQNRPRGKTLTVSSWTAAHSIHVFANADTFMLGAQRYDHSISSSLKPFPQVGCLPAPNQVLSQSCFHHL